MRGWRGTELSKAAFLLLLMVGSSNALQGQTESITVRGLALDGRGMRDSLAIPVTVKCRLGVDDQDPDKSLRALISGCAAKGVSTFIVHARKAWLPEADAGCLQRPRWRQCHCR